MEILTLISRICTKKSPVEKIKRKIQKKRMKSNTRILEISGEKR
jgi:hypothetical protein